MTRRAAGWIAIAALVPLVGACGSSSSPAKRSAASASPHPAASTSGTAVTATALAAELDKGLAGLTSAHLHLDASVIGSTSTEDAQFAGGQITASRTTLVTGGKTYQVVTVSTTSYAMLPSGQNTTGKPWVVVSASSTNQDVASLAGTLALTQASGALASLSDFLGATESVRDLGSAQVGGVATTHYALVIDASKLSGRTALEQEIAELKLATVPVDAWLDANGRPVQVRFSAMIGNQALPITLTVGNFNAPLSVAAPPADQIGS